MAGKVWCQTNDSPPLLLFTGLQFKLHLNHVLSNTRIRSSYPPWSTSKHPKSPNYVSVSSPAIGLFVSSESPHVFIYSRSFFSSFLCNHFTEETFAQVLVQHFNLKRAVSESFSDNQRRLAIPSKSNKSIKYRRLCVCVCAGVYGWFFCGPLVFAATNYRRSERRRGRNKGGGGMREVEGESQGGGSENFCATKITPPTVTRAKRAENI